MTSGSYVPWLEKSIAMGYVVAEVPAARDGAARSTSAARSIAGHGRAVAVLQAGEVTRPRSPGAAWT